MDFFKKTKEKLVQTVSSFTQHSCTDAELNGGIKKLDSLEGLLHSFRSKITNFSNSVSHLHDTNEEFCNEIQFFYRKNESRQKTIALFASIQSDGQYMKFKDSIGWGLLQQVDAWLSDIDDLKDNTRALDFALSKNNNSSNQQDKVALMAEINKMIESRFTKFDKMFIHFMEIQRDFFKVKYENGCKFNPVIASYNSKNSSSNNQPEEKSTSPKATITSTTTLPKHTVPEPEVVKIVEPVVKIAEPVVKIAEPVKEQPKVVQKPVEVDLFGGFATASSPVTAPAKPAPAPVPQQQNLFDLDFTSNTNASAAPAAPVTNHQDANLFDLFNSGPAKPSAAPVHHDAGFDILGLNSLGNNNANNHGTKPRVTAPPSSSNAAFDPNLFSSTSSTANSHSAAPSTSYSNHNSHIDDIDGIDDDVSTPSTSTSNGTAPKSKSNTDDFGMDFAFLGSSTSTSAPSKMDSFDPLSTGFSAPTKAAPKQDYVPQVVNTGPVLTEAEEKAAITNIKQSSDSRISSWKTKQGQDKNIQALLASLETVLWQGHSWKKMDSTQLLDYNSVKKAYRRALLTVHPDKVSGGTPEMKAIADSVFDILNVAYKNYEVSLGMRAA